MFDIDSKRYSTPRVEYLAYLAALVAVEAPVRTSDWGKAKVPWDLVKKIRAELTKAGFDWKTAATMHKERERETRYAAYAHYHTNPSKEG